MKKKTAWLAAALLLCFLAGCARPEKSVFTASDDILTYTRIDPKKTQIVVSVLGNNAEVAPLIELYEAQNPDVQVIAVDITGGDANYKPVQDWVTHGLAPDVMFVNDETFTEAEFVRKYLTDLSAKPYTLGFESEALNRAAVDARVYLLPAQSEVTCMLYNKMLFEKYGWELPGTFDEFVALCKRITADTEGQVQPWNPGAKYDSVFTTALEAFVYEEVFGGVANRSWYNEFCAGKASFAGHMEPFYAMLQRLIDEGLLKEEHFTYSATTRGQEFNAGKIAMINISAKPFNGPDCETAMMPFPSTAGGDGYVSDCICALACVPLKERSGAAQDAVERFMAVFCSEDGQRALIGETFRISNLKDMSSSYGGELAGIESVIRQGHKFSRMDFPGPGERSWTFRQNALDMVEGVKTGAECMAEIDAQPYLPEDAAEASPPIAQVAQDFTILEFSNYIADAYREKAGADIGLINHGIAYRGNLVRLFKGDIYEHMVAVIKPRSFDNGSALVKLSMTGAQLMEALNHPMGNGCVSDSVYAVSGLKCEAAPWNAPGEKYLWVKLQDGSELEPDRLYTVAAWEGTVADEYITATLERFEGTWEEFMTAKLKTDGVIKPAKDGRMKLSWK